MEKNAWTLKCLPIASIWYVMKQKSIEPIRIKLGVTQYLYSYLADKIPWKIVRYCKINFNFVIALLRAPDKVSCGKQMLLSN